MKKNNIYKVFALVLFAGMALTSCSDFLDKLPDERSEINTENDVQELLMTAYPDANFAWVAELSSDNLLDNQCPHLPSNPNKKQIITYYNYSAYDRWDDEMFKFEDAKSATYSSYDSPGSLWSGYYMSIANTNYCLNALDNIKRENGGVETERGKALRAEAQILRAWDHFCLVNVFSQAYKTESVSKNEIGVTYMTEPETVSKVEYDRGNVWDTYQLIKKDLEEALPNISDSYIGSYKHHFNSQAAHAFAARFYLYTRDWAKVIEHANEVLGTDSASVGKMMLDYTGFDDCSYLSDYATVWQNPNQNNNLMLSITGSLLQRRCFGYRYSLAGPKASEVMMVRTSSGLWSGYICPIQAVVAGMLFASSTKDYGFFSSKIGEEFEYSDKLAGIGYPHIVQRTFTAAELLLERAEAKLMMGDIEGGAQDLIWYWNSCFTHLSEKTQETYKAYWRDLTVDLILKNYTNTETKKRANCFDSWDFTQTIDPTYKVPEEAIPYMNCLNEFRRFENMFEGLRFFDLKRWGMPYTHEVGAEQEVFELGSNDPRRAIEVPWETISAGLESSRYVSGRAENPSYSTKELVVTTDN